MLRALSMDMKPRCIVVIEVAIEKAMMKTPIMTSTIVKPAARGRRRVGEPGAVGERAQREARKAAACMGNGLERA